MTSFKKVRLGKSLALAAGLSGVWAGAALLAGPMPVRAQDAAAAAPAAPAAPAPETQAYRDTSRPLAARVESLMGQMTLEEKTAQLQNGAPAIHRLGVPAYNYWSEGLHGIANEGIATVFPQAIGNAATWDPPLLHAIGDVVATEARAKYNAKGTEGDHGWFNGLTIWSPNINIFRDPRWGRGQETYGEDPFLTSRMGVAFIQGMQGDDPQHLKAVACAKHFAVHSGPEPLRHRFDVHPPERDLYETYLPQFEAAVREGHVGQVMSAYNAINGIPAPADKWLLTDLLRGQWGFDGYVVSDCDAVGDIVGGHHYADTREQAAADAVKAGTDLNCGGTYGALVSAVHGGQISEDEINTALRRVLTERFRLGLFDPPTYAYAKITAADNDTPQHGDLALRAARESMVLLKNDGLLPLDPAKLKHVAVIGANADDIRMLQGNYNGTPSHPISILQGLKDALGTGAEVTYVRGCPLAVNAADTSGPSSPEFQQAVEAAKSADVVIYVGGISARLEGEEMRVTMVGFTGGDRTRIELPQVQEDLLRAVAAVGKPVVYVNCSGSAMAIPWEADHMAAILQAWYPGQNGGTAVADVLLGRYNPGGRLPVTFYASTEALPDFQDYSMTNRTYRYYAGKALFPFGFGLSYTNFSYGKPRFSARRLGPAGTLQVTVPVRNTGARDGDEVVQVYVRHVKSAVPQPIHSLCAFQRVSVPKGQTRTATLTISPARFRYWDVTKKAYVVEPGPYEIQIGSSSADIRARQVITVTAHS